MDPNMMQQVLMMILGSGLGAGQAAAGQLPKRNILFGTGGTFDPIASGKQQGQQMSGAAGGPGGLIQLLLLKRLLEQMGQNSQQSAGNPMLNAFGSMGQPFGPFEAQP